MVSGKELENVAFRVGGEKLCRKCFHELPPKQIRFLPIPLALQRMSCVTDCSKCGKNIVEECDGSHKTGNQ